MLAWEKWHSIHPKKKLPMMCGVEEEAVTRNKAPRWKTDNSGASFEV